MRKIRIQRRSFGLYSKLALTIGISLGLAFTCVFIITQERLKKDQETFAVESTLLDVQGSVNRIELILTQLENQADTIYTNKYLYQPLTEESLTDYSAYCLALMLRTYLYTASGRLVYQIHLKHTNSDRNIEIRRDSMNLDDQRDEGNVRDTGVRGNSFGYGPNLADGYGAKAGETSSPEVFSLRKNIYDTETQKKIGSITFDIHIGMLKTTLFTDLNDSGFLSYVSGSRDVIITSKNYQFTDEEAPEQDVAEVKALCSIEGWNRYSRNDLRDFVFGSEFSINGQRFYLARFIPESEVFQYSKKRQHDNAVIMLLGCLMSAVFALSFAHLITKPIRQVDKALDNMAKPGALSYRLRHSVRYSGRDEVGRLIEKADHLLDVIEEQFYQEEILREKQKRAEAKMLQAQINPHFLYNALQSIAYLAIQYGEEDVFEYITLLGSMMHYCMDLTSEAVLREEFDYVKGYLSLQNIRFGNMVDVHIQLSPEAADIMVPKMVLQPLVENAYKHGDIFRRKDSRILIRADVEKKSTGDQLILEIDDNGKGCSSASIEALNRMLSKEKEEFEENNTHVGIGNVYHRLYLFFDGRIRMQVNGSEENGFAVRIQIDL